MICLFFIINMESEFQSQFYLTISVFLMLFSRAQVFYFCPKKNFKSWNTQQTTNQVIFE